MPKIDQLRVFAASLHRNMFVADRWHRLALMLIVLAGVWLRYANVAWNPGWYTDEGTHVIIAQNLVQTGLWQYMAINQSTLLFAKLPLFELVLAGMMRVFGASIITLRWLTAGLGSISVVVAYLVVSDMSRDRNLGLAAAGAFAIYQTAVLYARFGFSYNLLVPFVLMSTWGLSKYVTADPAMGRRGLLFSAVVVALGIMTDLAMVGFAIVLGVVVLWHNWRDGWWSFPIVVAPFLIYAAVSLWVMPDAFAFDLEYTLTRLGGRTFGQQLSLVGENLAVLLTQEWWFAAGVIGLWLIPLRPMRNILLLSLIIPIFMIGRTVPLFSLSAYYMIPMLPLIAVGVGGLFCYGAELVITQIIKIGSLKWAGILVIIVSISLLYITSGPMLAVTRSEYVTDIDPFLLSGSDATAAAEYLKVHLEATDVTIASPGFAWQLTTPTADFQMVAAYRQVATPHLPADIPAERFAFDPSYAGARFVVVDNLWHSWAAVHVPGVDAILLTVEDWPIGFQSGHITVYENPMWPVSTAEPSFP